MIEKSTSVRGRNLLVELLMLVVGINIALWFEGRFEDMQEARTEVQYLEGLRDDLRKDLANLASIIEQNNRKTARLAEIVPALPSLATASPEVQASTMFEPSSYVFFEPSDFTYRSMIESGDFRLLSDAEIKAGILRLIRHYRFIATLQANFIQALDDGYIPLMMSRFDLVQARLEDPTIVDELVFRNFFAFALQDTGDRATACKAAMDQAQALLGQIEAQLGDG